MQDRALQQLPGFETALSELRAMGGVVVVGAGLSIAARLPAIQGLETLLWQALSEDRSALETLRAAAGCEPGSSAKETVLSFNGELGVAWEILAGHPTGRAAFQEAFVRLDSARRNQLSPSHDVLAELLHRGIVELVVSLNWDSQLETAWRRRYGQEVPSELLAKPHGSVTEPTQAWVLPGEQRQLPEVLKARLASMVAEHPRLLLIVGYSEQDELVVREVVEPLEERWRVIRISPAAQGELAVPYAAETALPALREDLDLEPETPGFAYVSFEPAHDLAWAMAGRSLGPPDVETCPEAIEVKALVSEIEVTGSAVLIGESGAGKSLAAFHAAHGFWRRGWEVLRLKELLPLEDLRQTLRTVPRPAIVVLDDAQRLADDDLTELLAAAESDLGVLAVHSQRSPIARAGVRLDAQRAARTLLAYLRANPTEALSAVRSLDRHVGTGYLDTRLEDRLREAGEKARSPWQLTFMITAGWNRVGNEIDELRADSKHDVVLALIAAIQLLRLDESVERRDLARVANWIGYPEDWVTRAIERAAAQRLLVVDGAGVRLPHQRFAAVVIEAVLARGDRALALQAINGSLIDLEPGLRGVHWLLHELFFLSRDAGVAYSAVLTVETATMLLARCWTAQTGSDRGAAAEVINDLRRLETVDVAIEEHVDQLADWISAGQPEAMSGLARLINDCYNDKLEVLEDLYSRVHVDRLAAAFVFAGWPDAVFIARLIDRFGLGSRQAKAALWAAIDRDAARQLIQSWADGPEVYLFDLSEVVEAIATLDLEFALECLELVATRFAERWQENFLWGFNDMREITFVLGLGPSFLRRRPPNKRQRQVARQLVEGLDARLCARQISNSTEREWELVGHAMAEFVENASARKAQAIADQVDFDRLNVATADFWATRTWTMRGLLAGLALGPDYEPARGWIAANADKMQEVSLLALAISPEACAGRLADAEVKLQWGAREDLGLTVEALAKLEQIDHELAATCLRDNKEHLSGPMTIVDELEDWPAAIKLFDHLDSSAVSYAIAQVDPDKARTTWTHALRGESGRGYGSITRRRRGAAVLIEAATRSGGAIAQLAAELERQFPAASAVE